LLRSYRLDEWSHWFAAAGLTSPPTKGPMFDSSVTMAEVAAQGAGIALLPAVMFSHDLKQRRLIRPFQTEVTLGEYWLTSLRSKRASAATRAFKAWLLHSVATSKA
jgi:LysR family transcriptional regulator of beta-lactamase